MAPRQHSAVTPSFWQRWAPLPLISKWINTITALRRPWHSAPPPPPAVIVLMPYWLLSSGEPDLPSLPCGWFPSHTFNASPVLLYPSPPPSSSLKTHNPFSQCFGVIIPQADWTHLSAVRAGNVARCVWDGDSEELEPNFKCTKHKARQIAASVYRILKWQWWIVIRVCCRCRIFHLCIQFKKCPHNALEIYK